MQNTPVLATIRPIHLLQYLALIALEATFVHLGASLLTLAAARLIVQWSVLVGVVAVAALANASFETPNTERTRIYGRTAAIAVATILVATWLQVHGALGDGQASLQLLPRFDDQALLPLYVIVAANLWAWWRGAQLVDAGHAEVVRLLRVGTVTLTVMLIVLGLGAVETPLDRPIGGMRLSVAGQIVILLALGLASLSLTRIVAAESDGVGNAQWNWLRSGLLSTVGVLLASLSLLAFVAEPARWLLSNGLLWAIYLMVLLISPVLWLLFGIIEVLRRLIASVGWTISMPEARPAEEQTSLTEQLSFDALEPILNISATVLALIPLAILALLIIFAARRRGRREQTPDEQRESIFTWDALGRNVMEMLRGLLPTTTGTEGLSAALARLSSTEPATRIRRRYVQLLLLGEERGQQRPSAATPHEFESALPASTNEQPSVSALTALYEHARYAPDSIDSAAADRADESWQTLEQTKRRDRGQG